MSVFLFLLLGVATQVLSQTCPWNIEVCQTSLPYNEDELGAISTCGTGNCYRVYYHFYLVNSNYENGPYTSDIPISLSSLILTGALTTTPLLPGLSEVNLKESEACSTAGPGINTGANNTPFLDYDPQTNIIVYQLSPGPGSSSITYFTYGRMPLFVLAVDVFPGEQVSLGSLSYDLQLASGTVCSDVVNLCQTNISQTIAQPSTDCTFPNFLIGSPVSDPTTAYPNRQKIPVWVATSFAFTWNELDFLMTALPSGNIQTPSIEGVQMDATDVKVYVHSGQYRIYAHSKTPTTIASAHGTAPDSYNTLFYIVFNGPIFESECAKVQIRFALDPMNTSGTTYGRVDGGPSSSYQCCKPKFSHPAGGAVGIQWGPSTNCSTLPCSNITLEVLPNPITSTSTCGTELYFDLYATSTEKIDVTGLRFALKVHNSGSFSFNSSSSTSPYCSSITSCVTTSNISADYLRVVYNVSGLSLNINGPTYIGTIALSTLTNGCILGIDFLDALVTSSGGVCIPGTHSAFLNNNNDDDICALGQQLIISAATETGAPIDDWNYYINQLNTAYNNPSCEQSGTSAHGSYPICACIPNPNAVQNVVLTKGGNYLNGVSTYDLVLITKHILGVEPFTSNIKILAADANGDKKVTAFDIIELRKLILTLYTFRLPKVNSWRFFDKAFANSSTFQDAVDPFSAFHGRIQYTAIPDGSPDPMFSEVALNFFAIEEFGEFALPPIGIYDTEAEFVGYKIGDVNNSVLANFNQLSTEDRNAKILTFGTKTVKGQTGTIVDIPVFSTAQQSLIGWQMALNFDPSLLKIKGIRWPTDLSYGQDQDWNLAQPGELRLLWFDAMGAAKTVPGTPLFFVQAELLKPLTNQRLLLWPAPNSIPQEAYDEHGQHYAIHLESSGLPVLPNSSSLDKVIQAKYKLSAYPNPAGTNFRLDIEANQAITARLRISDLLGRELTTRTLDLIPGLNTINSAQLPGLIAGQYVVTLYTPTGIETLRLIKQ